ncbi:MAG TPA: hypothetical protein VGV93_13960 [Acidimicrobiales bacterium]|nr:hypothetical protein [Acidimicrobiales bacterium]
MSWRVFATDASRPDFERLTEAERDALAEVLFSWVESGPRRTNRRLVAGVEIFEDELPPGIGVTYFVDESERYVAILRVRKL